MSRERNVSKDLLLQGVSRVLALAIDFRAPSIPRFSAEWVGSQWNFGYAISENALDLKVQTWRRPYLIPARPGPSFMIQCIYRRGYAGTGVEMGK
jgi:hypothetical protein